MRLRPTIQLEFAIDVVNASADAARQHLEELRNIRRVYDQPWRSYLQWANDSERQFRKAFDDPPLVTQLHSARYWKIVELPAVDPMMKEHLIAELETQIQSLSEVGARLRGYLGLRDRAGHVAVVDTNALLQHQCIDGIKWSEVVGEGPVRLVIPVRVLEELDRKSYEGMDSTRRRALSAIRPLDDRHPELEKHGFAFLNDGGDTVEYLTDERGHQPRTRTDEEILDRAEFLQQVTRKQVTVITGDNNMRARAVGRQSGLRMVKMPPRFRRDQDTPDP